MECRRPYDYALWAVYAAIPTKLGIGEFTKTNAQQIILSMETPTPVTFEAFIEMVKQMRHNQRRFENLNKPEINETRKDWEKKVDAAVAQLTDTQIKMF